MPDIDEHIASLDLGLFRSIPTQSSNGDRRAWLAIQRVIRNPAGYDYLEIGSHLGGSIQQHIQDPRCRTIVSIDKRPASQPDERGLVFHYEGNSTRRMLESLRRVAPEGLNKLLCFDADAAEIDPSQIPVRPEFCFIDGEHTYHAVRSDFAFCQRVCSSDAAICFHDDWLISGALRAILSELQKQGVSFVARKLSGDTFGIFLGNCPAARDPYIQKHSWDGFRWLRYLPYFRWIYLWVLPVMYVVATKLHLLPPAVDPSAEDTENDRN